MVYLPKSWKYSFQGMESFHKIAAVTTAIRVRAMYSFMTDIIELYIANKSMIKHIETDEVKRHTVRGHMVNSIIPMHVQSAMVTDILCSDLDQLQSESLSMFQWLILSKERMICLKQFISTNNQITNIQDILVVNEGLYIDDRCGMR